MVTVITFTGLGKITKNVTIYKVKYFYYFLNTFLNTDYRVTNIYGIYNL